ncbi:hypothetical protein [Ahrensia sp. R2A130]|uniref:hypothetical protein n=1 Tax=Ahrensia sp. R2A130 TaxID=744979 RepID=UPI0001E0C2FC|nr:hypothetical protein [Ahrensia sp. R2A130]EFL90205.1 hypothetical protein R2A130_0274 [Ahrensia sp. R2A130]
MDFFSAFASLGYSSIVLIIAMVFATAVVWNGLKMYARPIWMRLVLLAIAAVAFGFATIFLAEQRAIVLNDLKESEFEPRDPSLPGAPQPEAAPATD